MKKLLDWFYYHFQTRPILNNFIEKASYGIPLTREEVLMMNDFAKRESKYLGGKER